MKTKLTIAAILILIVVFSCYIFNNAYNRQFWDMTYSYEYAVIAMPNGSYIEGKVNSWRDFDDGDQIQVKIDGVTYLTHMANVVMISE